MNQLLNLLLTASFAVTFSETSGIMQWFKWHFHITQLKPFDCPKCMGMWLGFFIALITAHTFFFAVGYGCLCSVASLIILKLIR